MGMSAVKGSDDTAADHAAVFVICLRKHHDMLGNTALREHVTPPQIDSNLLPQLFHDAGLSGFGQRYFISAGYGKQQHMGNLPAACQCTALGKAEENNAFVTIMTNVNVLAVASLINMSVVIVCENAQLSEEFVAGAKDKGINVLKSSLPAFETCVALSKMI